jgi:hypothetical protein
VVFSPSSKSTKSSSKDAKPSKKEKRLAKIEKSKTGGKNDDSTANGGNDSSGGDDEVEDSKDSSPKQPNGDHADEHDAENGDGENGDGENGDGDNAEGDDQAEDGEWEFEVTEEMKNVAVTDNAELEDPVEEMAKLLKTHEKATAAVKAEKVKEFQKQKHFTDEETFQYVFKALVTDNMAEQVKSNIALIKKVGNPFLKLLLFEDF